MPVIQQTPYKIAQGQVCWARSQVTEDFARLSREVRTVTQHWSRAFEYPWVLTHGDFCKGLWVLDAGGGDAPLQMLIARRGAEVLNVDTDEKSHQKYLQDYPNIRAVPGNLRDIPYPNDTFLCVVCASVLEHIQNPLEVVHELWRVLAPGGRLLVTLDVANYARHNHTIDVAVAQEILDLFGMTLSDPPPDTLHYTFDELEPEPKEPRHVHLKVLCFFCDKP